MGFLENWNAVNEWSGSDRGGNPTKVHGVVQGKVVCINQKVHAEVGVTHSTANAFLGRLIQRFQEGEGVIM